MGTRADFYVGRGADAEWLGSIAWDGYPDGIADTVLDAKNEQDFRDAVESFLSGRRDATMPAMGWPWPWETSATTDYAYAFDGVVHASCFGGNWFNPRNEPDDDDEDRNVTGDPAVFPDMSDRKNVQIGGARSGILVFSMS